MIPCSVYFDQLFNRFFYTHHVFDILKGIHAHKPTIGFGRVENHIQFVVLLLECTAALCSNFA